MERRVVYCPAINFSRSYPRVVVYNGQQNFGVKLPSVAGIKQKAKSLYAKHGGKIRRAALTGLLMGSPAIGAGIGEGAAAVTPVPQTYTIAQPATDMAVYEVNKGGNRMYTTVKKNKDGSVNTLSPRAYDLDSDKDFIESAAKNYMFPKN